VVLNLTGRSTRPRCVTLWNGTRWQPSARAHSQYNPVPRARQQARALLREEPRSNQREDIMSGIAQLRLDLLLLLNHDAIAPTEFQSDHVRRFGSPVGKEFARDQWGRVHGLVLQLHIQRVALISPSTILVQQSKSSWPKQQSHARHRCSIKRPRKISSEDTGRPNDHRTQRCHW
jgi:hypothetical protein